ncbi:hypothetical protein OC842_006472 [Tilletia horrida]|uniref:Uncharacterized protein n=1 Tax=Tilletia horrida TaxID=155126 RepID=A0AAN6G5U1_9BASI|nr:hypothetical protein OC842_006472 [Tilletia horrida]
MSSDITDDNLSDTDLADQPQSRGVSPSSSVLSSPSLDAITTHNQNIILAALQVVDAEQTAEPRSLTGIRAARSRGKGKKYKWDRVAEVKTQHVYQWFESQRNDYHPRDVSRADFVSLVWTGHPGDTPNDLTSRAWFVQFQELSRKELRRVSSKNGEVVVMRAHFHCAGKCSIKDPEEDDASDTSCSQSSYEGMAEEETKEKKLQRKGRPKEAP